MVKFMFGHRFTCQAAMPMALFGITFCSNHGYWTAPLILLLFGLGATVFGTLCRMIALLGLFFGYFLLHLR